MHKRAFRIAALAVMAGLFALWAFCFLSGSGLVSMPFAVSIQGSEGCTIRRVDGRSVRINGTDVTNAVPDKSLMTPDYHSDYAQGARFAVTAGDGIASDPTQTDTSNAAWAMDGADAKATHDEVVKLRADFARRDSDRMERLSATEADGGGEYVLMTGRGVPWAHAEYRVQCHDGVRLVPVDVSPLDVLRARVRVLADARYGSSMSVIKPGSLIVLER